MLNTYFSYEAWFLLATQRQAQVTNAGTVTFCCLVPFVPIKVQKTKAFLSVRVSVRVRLNYMCEYLQTYHKLGGKRTTMTNHPSPKRTVITMPYNILFIPRDSYSCCHFESFTLDTFKVHLTSLLNLYHTHFN